VFADLQPMITGASTFGVSANGVQELADFSIYQAAGAPYSTCSVPLTSFPCSKVQQRSADGPADAGGS
jgi:hypothetical protein